MYIYTYIQKYIFIWKKHDHGSERHIFSRSNYALPCVYHAQDYDVPTTMVLRQYGSNYVINRSLPRPLTVTLLLRKF